MAEKISWAAETAPAFSSSATSPKGRLVRFAEGFVRHKRSDGSDKGASSQGLDGNSNLDRPLLDPMEKKLQLQLRHSEPPRSGLKYDMRHSERSEESPSVDYAHFGSEDSGDEEFGEDADQPQVMAGTLSEVPEEPATCRDRLHRLMPVLSVGTLVVLGAIFHKDVEVGLNMFVDWVQALGLWAPWILALAVAALQLLMLPTFPLMAGAGVIFPKIFGYVEGQAIGVASVFVGLWLGSMGTFVLGRRCFKEWAEEELKKVAWMTIVNNMINEQGWWVVLLARMSPLLPAEVFNYACSLTSLSLCAFGVGCLGSIVPTTMWVCTAASAARAAAAATTDDDRAPSPEQRGQNLGSLLFIGFNIAFLVGLTLLLYGAFLKYKEKATHHVDRHIEDFRRSSKKLSEEKVMRLRHQLTGDLAFQRLRTRKLAPRRRSTGMPFARSVTWSGAKVTDAL